MVPEWKCNKIQMDFVTGPPKSQKGNDAIFVVIDQFSKVAHFLPVKETITASQLANLYISRIVSLHGIPKEISSDRGSIFTSKFWDSFQEAMGTHITWSTAYHPESQGQVERVNQILEDMLRACVISFGKKWEESLPYAEFSYNNSYQASLKMAPFEVLYGRKCRTPLNWSETGERSLFGPDIIQHAEDIFTSKFWDSFQEAMGTHITWSTAYHPESQGQVERVNQILEDMLRACVISFGKKWEESLPYAEFSYNNSYQASLKMAPFEVLYGRKCRTPLNWSETGERSLFGPDIIQHAEDQVRIIHENLKAAQSRQKSQYDRHHQDMVYQPGEQAYLRVTPMRGAHRFGIKGKLAPRYIGRIKGKLAPRYIGLFTVLERRGRVAYRLELPANLSQVHNVFHVSQLRRCFKDPIRAVDHDMLELQQDLSYKQHPVRILDQAERKTRRKVTKFLKVQWSNHSEDEATWEREDNLRDEYPGLFPSTS